MQILYALVRSLIRQLLQFCYGVQIHGLEHYQQAGPRVLIIANHTSFLDAALLATFLPDKLTFAIDTRESRRWYSRAARLLVDLFPMDPLNPLSTKSLIKYMREDHRAVIFPEGRITITGSLMKIYQGPGLIADRADAVVLPIRIEGAQYTPFSKLRGRVRIRWFPAISLTLLPPRKLKIDTSLSARERRNRAGQELSDIMTEMMFATSQWRSTIVNQLFDAHRIHGRDHVIVEDPERQPLNYGQLMLRARILSSHIAQQTDSREYVGVLLPSSLANITLFIALHLRGRVPAMLNFTVGSQGLLAACDTAKIKTIYTARRFVQTAKLEKTVAALSEHVRIIYLEDISTQLGFVTKLSCWLTQPVARQLYRRQANQPTATDAAVVLFTSGSEGTPKGVVLSHRNLLANVQQLASRVDFSSQDIILNALPLFHSFGLTAGTILPLLTGMRTFFYPSPLHYRIIPEIAYDINATILFGTSTFLAGYARFAHPYDFNSLRYVFAGAEKLRDEVRIVWEEKFGVRIFEGYGATETSPALASNTAMASRTGTVGRLLPAIEYYLEPVAGVSEGGRLHVRGPNIMSGYLLNSAPGVLVPPKSSHGDGWYDTGDIVTFDADGYITIRGRAKRFAKIAGEMVSLTAVETLASKTWPNALHAVVAIPDAQKGEQLILLTTQSPIERSVLLERAKRDGIGEINVPKKFIPLKQIPLLATGKTDYVAALALATQQFANTTEPTDEI